MKPHLPSCCADLSQTFAWTRCQFLQVGGVSLGGNLLGPLMAQADAPAQRKPRRACIFLFQVGGPYQCDTFDPKSGAPEEVRGPYKPLRTRVPGMQVTEALPGIAQHADKFAILRGVNHTIRCHNPAIYCSLVGREATDPMAVSSQTGAKRTDHPHYASVLSRLRPATEMPGHVVIPDVVFNGPARTPGLMAGYLGAAHDPLVLGADPAAANFRFDGLGLPEEVTPVRLDDRRSLLERLDNQQRRLEKSDHREVMSTFQQRAFDLLTTPRTRKAFDLEQEPARLRERYGRHTAGQSTLLARRLVEVGVRFVSVFSHTVVERESWDTHNKHDELNKTVLLPKADQSFSALLEDLSVRGLLDEVLVVWLGEFRPDAPPRGVNFSNNTNNVGGRDHWCNCYSVVLAGGGVRGGQVVGSSDWIGGYPKERPVHISDLAATVFHALGVDPRGQVYDPQRQPHNICDGRPVEELF